MHTIYKTRKSKVQYTILKYSQYIKCIYYSDNTDIYKEHRGELRTSMFV